MQQHYEMVERFLTFLGQRDLASASALLAPDFLLTVSGGHRFTKLQEFASFSKSRNGPTVKQRDRYEGFQTEASAVVYSIGRMSGAWLDGSTFEQVRYIDRFELKAGLIETMDVWSDMAEFRPGNRIRTGAADGP